MEEPMKIKRCLLAVAVTVTAAACSADVTAPDAALRAPASAHESAAALEETTTTSTSTTTIIEPVQPDPDDTGSTGSGCCLNR
jgi:ABC-type glycerol-3-phosphate transport system substrate-binding protein